MSIARRIETLERAINSNPCPACAHRRGIYPIDITGRQGPDQSELPQPCPICGAVPEVIVLEQVIPTGEEPWQ